MADGEDTTAFMVEQLSVIGPVRARRMFGGVGLYTDGVMFALIADDMLYLKADGVTRDRFAAAGSAAFTYDGKTKPVTMSYWRAPEFLFEDAEAMADWAGEAVAVARRAEAQKLARKTARQGVQP